MQADNDDCKLKASLQSTIVGKRPNVKVCACHAPHPTPPPPCSHPVLYLTFAKPPLVCKVPAQSMLAGSAYIAVAAPGLEVLLLLPSARMAPAQLCWFYDLFANCACFAESHCTNSTEQV